MNREILFRGKRIDNGKWVYGDLFHGKDGLYIQYWEKGEYRSYEVSNKTVCQDTGLTDKNGAKIFDGDILAGSMYPFTHDGDRNYYAVVVWFENSPAFGIETAKAPESSVSGISAGNTDYMEGWDPQCWEVIGNIYDNHELLST